MLDTQRPVADLILEHPECAAILSRHRIDFCCRGHLPLADAAAQRQLDVPALVAELERAIDDRTGPTDNPAALTTPDLIAHVVDVHHAYLRESLPFILGLATKVARVHGNHDPQLRDVAAHTHALADTLLPHLDYEEQTLFPKLIQQQSPLDDELTAMLAEHHTVGTLLTRIRESTRDFALPDWACMSFRTLFSELEHLEGAVLTHVHLENHALLPRFLPREVAS